MFLQFRIYWAWDRHAKTTHRLLQASNACLTPAEPLIQLCKHYRRKRAVKAYNKSYSRLLALLEKEMG